MNSTSVATAPNILKQDATVISLVGFAHGTSHFYHLMMPPLFPFLMREYSLSFTQVGALTTVFFVVSCVGQALAGILVDRWGAHRVLCLGLSLLTLSGILIAASPALWGLYVAAFVAGLGNSIFHPADFSLLNHRVSQHRLGHAFSVHGLSGNLGWALAPVVMTGAATAFGWRAAGVAAALVGGASLTTVWYKRAALADAMAGEEPAHELHSGARSRVGFTNLIRIRLTWFAFAFLFFSTMGFGALQNFAPSILGRLYGLSLAAATSGLTAYLIGSASGLATGGFLAGGKAGQERLVGLAFFCSASIAFLLSLAVVPAAAVIGLMAAMGFGVGLASPSRDMLVRKSTAARFGAGTFGRMAGLVYSGADLALATSPLVFGALLDAGSTRSVLMGVSASLVIAIIAAQAIAADALS